MLKDSQGRGLWIADEFGRHTPIESHADFQNRSRAYGEPDWWVVAKDKDWTPPEPRSLLSLGAAAEGSGGGMKTGAGHKPQGYDKFGRYTGPRGGSISMDGGPVRLYADEADENPGGEESPEDDTGGKPEETTEEV